MLKEYGVQISASSGNCQIESMMKKTASPHQSLQVRHCR